jgi:hypothetical protein
MRGVVQAFCRTHGIAYHEQGFWSAVRDVFVHLRRVGRIDDAPSPSRSVAGPDTHPA